MLEKLKLYLFPQLAAAGLAGKTKRNERGRKRRRRRRRGYQNRPLPPLGPSSMAEHAAGNGEEKGERRRERESDRERESEAEGVLGMKKGWEEMSVYIYILEKITTNYPIIYS